MVDDSLRQAFEDADTEMEELPNEFEIAEAGDRMLNDVAPTATPEQKAEAQRLAGRKLQTGEGTPKMEEALAHLKQDPSSAPLLVDAAGESRSEVMGALLSLVLPVLAGAAIGGKRGALHASVGAGKGKLAAIEQEEKRELEAAKAGAATKAQIESDKRKSNLRKEEAREEFERENNPEQRMLERQKNIEDAGDKGAATNLTESQKSASQAEGIFQVSDQILSEFGKAIKDSKGRLVYQVKKNFTASDLGKLQARVHGLVFKIVKAEQGSRPSDYDVKAMMKIVSGDWTNNEADAYKLLYNAMRDSRTVIEARVKADQDVINKRLGKESSLSTAEKTALDKANERARGAGVAQELTSLQAQPKLIAKLEQAKEMGASKKEVKAKLKGRVSDEILTMMGFK